MRKIISCAFFLSEGAQGDVLQDIKKSPPGFTSLKLCESEGGGGVDIYKRGSVNYQKSFTEP
jgi:hypothetical protein